MNDTENLFDQKITVMDMAESALINNLIGYSDFVRLHECDTDKQKKEVLKEALQARSAGGRATRQIF